MGIHLNNSVFQRSCAVLLTGLDRFFAIIYSDLVGRIQIPVAELIEKPNQMLRRTDPLKGFEDADGMTGHLHWSIGYFEKVPLKKELERGLTAEEQKAKPADPPKTAPEQEMRPDDQAPNPAKKDLPPPPPDVEKTRPDPEYPSGVLSIVLHHVSELGMPVLLPMKRFTDARKLNF